MNAYDLSLSHGWGHHEPAADAEPITMLLVPDGDLPREVFTKDTSGFISRFAGKDPSRVVLSSHGDTDVTAFVNEDTKLPANRVIDGEVIYGTFVIAAVDRASGRVVDLEPNAAIRLKTRFADPSEGPFELAKKQMRITRENRVIPGMKPADMAALVSRLAGNPGNLKPNGGGTTHQGF